MKKQNVPVNVKNHNPCGQVSMKTPKKKKKILRGKNSKFQWLRKHKSSRGTATCSSNFVWSLAFRQFVGTILLFLELQGFLNEQHNDIQYQHIDLASENAHACTWTSVDVCLMTTSVVKGLFVIYG